MEITDIFGPPPAGVDLAEDQSGTVVAPIVVVLVLAIAAVVLRFTTRSVVEAQSMEIDDMMILVALIFCFGTAGCVFAALSFGCGRHVWTLSTEDFKHIQQIVYAAAQIYATAVTCTKTSIILYYRRIFDFTTTYYVSMFLIVGYWITIIVVMNTGCHPVHYMWNQYVDPRATGECVDLLKFYYANAIAASLIDIFILLTPVYPVWKLQMPTTKKLAVLGIFLLGGVVVGASIARICSLLKMAGMMDQSWGLCSGLIWTCLEPCVGIISACLPTLGPLIRHCSGKISSHLSQSCENGTDQGGTDNTRGSRSTKKAGLSIGHHTRSVEPSGTESDEYELRQEVSSSHSRMHGGSVRTSEETDITQGAAVTQEFSFNQK